MKRELLKHTNEKGATSTKLLIAHDGGMCWVTRSTLSTGKVFYRVLFGAKKKGQRDEEATAYQVTSTVSLAAALRYKNEVMTILNLGGKVPEQSKRGINDLVLVDTSDMVDAEYYPDEETDEAWQRVYGYGMKFVNEKRQQRIEAANAKLIEDMQNGPEIGFMGGFTAYPLSDE